MHQVSLPPESLDGMVPRLTAYFIPQCIEWLNQIALTYALAPRYCHVLFSLEELSKRELKSSMELDAIMAGRRETRPSSPEFGRLMV